ncbi:neuronal acetylcholine receptor subunit non-alpha-3-like isoform X2 [Phyllopteryx taeniolatus]|uniref:neuronal acetylcholine receptor subunit non-alpha-3-like isoform X2 n=1 Tax=Phyllopteryx taeniolatus TaxID=161469 RepID=UPI002AD39D42|nr:neuronal acetylcholine receptor subunit non-alpha-3-like isoform X2 [Phyllopteryx taeniolatus]
MMLATGSFFFITLLFTGVVSSERVCSYHEVLDHLNMSTLNSLYSMTRPVKDYRKPTVVSLEVILYAILDVREIDQTFIPYVWIFTSWHNEHISWDPEQFCGIKSISLPTELLWKPDLTIEEMIEKDKAPPSPHLTIFSSGSVHVQNDQVLLSTCKMNIYQFPFDRQSCNLTFKSVIHSGTPAASLAQLRRSHQVVAGGDVYAERVALYRHGGRQQDRQRVRHPAKHDRLYPVYCIGIFALMLLSLLETIFAMYLMEKDTVGEDGNRELDYVAEKKKSRCCVCICDAPADENPPEMLKDGRLTEFSSLEKLSHETRDLMKALTLLLDSRKEKEAKPGYWTRFTLKINRIFYIIYIITVSLFLAVMCFIWQQNHQE